MSIRQDSMRGYKTPPDVQIIGARSLFIEVPETGKEHALRQLIDLLKEIYAAQHLPPPEFVGLLEREIESSGR